MLNQDYFHVDFEKYAPVFPSYPGSASNERLSDVMVKIKYDHANDDYYYLPGIEFLQKMMKEMNSSKKSKKTQFPRVWRTGMTFILPGTLFGLPNGSWGLLGYGVNKGFDGKLYFFLEKIPLNKAMEKNYQILVFRKKIS